MDLGPALGLPPLPTLSLVLHAALSDPRTRATLRAITAAFRTAPAAGRAARIGRPEG